jgi:hypothetical protein
MIRYCLLLLLPFLQSVLGQEDFQCGVLEAAQVLKVTKDFDTVAPEATCRSRRCKILAPNTVHWHVYTIPDGETPRYSMFPDNLVEPYVEGSVLKWAWNKEGLQGVNKGDKIQAGVNLYIPASKMKRIKATHVDGVVEIINTDPSSALESIFIQDTGVDNTLYVSSPASKVQYKGSGVDATLYLEAASGSSIDISGVDQTVRVKTVDDLNVKMSGVDQKVVIDGGESGDDIQIQMSGVDNKAYVNGNSGCDDVTTSGVDNNCYITEKTVSFPELECLASTKVVNWSSWSVSDTAAVACGIVLGVLVVAIFGCVFCCCRRRKRNIITREEKPPAQAARKDIPFGAEETAADPRKDNAFGLEAAAYTSKVVIPVEVEATAEAKKGARFGVVADDREKVTFAHAVPVEARVF